MRDLINLAHDELQEAEIAILWILEPRMRKGKRCLGTCQILPEWAYRLTGINIKIELDQEFWNKADEQSRRYLIDHELCHATVKLDKAGDPECDETGWVQYISVPHDVEEFAGPIKRFGLQNSDLETFVEQTSDQLSLAFDKPAPQHQLRAV